MAINVVEFGEQVVAYGNNNKFTLNGNVCIECMQCTPVCPTEALFVNEWSVEVGDDHVRHIFNSGSLAVHDLRCNVGSCGEPCVEACPVMAITVEPIPDEPASPPPCEVYQQDCIDYAEGVELARWLENCEIITPKSIHNFLQSDAASWGMTVTGYIENKLDLIRQSGADLKWLGQMAKIAGWTGIAYDTYTGIMAFTDGKLTANEALGIASSTLGVLVLIPGMGTVIGISGLVVLGSGSIIIGLMSDLDMGKDTTIANFNTHNTCNQ